MLDQLTAAPADPILALISAYHDDPREEKIDLGVGVYRNDQGATPVMAAVKEAEKRLLDAQTTKAYVGMAGAPAFNGSVADLVLGTSDGRSRTTAIQSPGGCGALRLLADLVRSAKPETTVLVSDPTWPNHVPILERAGLSVDTYPYLDREKMLVNEDAMLDRLSRTGPGDVVLLHGSCHNPTGANLSQAGWEALADLAADRGFLPFVDIAYQGFGDGLDGDAAGLRILAAKAPEMLVASSCSKNFGLYRERAGCAMIIGETAEKSAIAGTRAMAIARGSYSMPPDHGAAVVAMILDDDGLREQWRTELDVMRSRMGSLRQSLASALRTRTGDDRFDYVERHSGMFSLLGTTVEQITRLREEFAIYAVGAGRINIAGLRESQVDRFADALVAVTEQTG